MEEILSLCGRLKQGKDVSTTKGGERLHGRAFDAGRPPPLALSEILLLHLGGIASVYRRDDVPGTAGKAGRNTDGCRSGQ